MAANSGAPVWSNFRSTMTLTAIWRADTSTYIDADDRIEGQAEREVAASAANYYYYQD